MILELVWFYDVYGQKIIEISVRVLAITWMSSSVAERIASFDFAPIWSALSRLSSGGFVEVQICNTFRMQSLLGQVLHKRDGG